jgi:hypothetical protein
VESDRKGEPVAKDIIRWIAATARGRRERIGGEASAQGRHAARPARDRAMPSDAPTRTTHRSSREVGGQSTHLVKALLDLLLCCLAVERQHLVRVGAARSDRWAPMERPPAKNGDPAAAAAITSAAATGAAAACRCYKSSLDRRSAKERREEHHDGRKGRGFGDGRLKSSGRSLSARRALEEGADALPPWPCRLLLSCSTTRLLWLLLSD